VLLLLLNQFCWQSTFWFAALDIGAFHHHRMCFSYILWTVPFMIFSCFKRCYHKTFAFCFLIYIAIQIDIKWYKFKFWCFKTSMDGYSSSTLGKSRARGHVMLCSISLNFTWFVRPRHIPFKNPKIETDSKTRKLSKDRNSILNSNKVWNIITLCFKVRLGLGYQCHSCVLWNLIVKMQQR
jgi:hypothetical protein